MEIPLRKENARYVRGQLFPGQTKRGFFADCIEENYLWAEYFAHGVWISDEERGLAWGIDSQENWSLDEEDKPVIILNDGQTVHLKLNPACRGPRAPEVHHVPDGHSGETIAGRLGKVARLPV
jgi:hypothetical protein